MIMSKTILVTGTSNGFGADIVTTLAAAGYRVFATMREMNGRHRAAAEALRAKGIHTLELDVTDNASVDAACRTASGDGRHARRAGQQRRAGGGRHLRDLYPNSCATCSRSMSLGVQRVLRAALPAMHAQSRGW
jgi:NADP-dependent 3-hydroxy acid dehydrogenase YdfG